MAPATKDSAMTSATQKTTDPAPWQDLSTCSTSLQDTTVLSDQEVLEWLSGSEAASGVGWMEDIIRGSGPFTSLPSLHKTRGLFNSDLANGGEEKKARRETQEISTDESFVDLLDLLDDVTSFPGDQSINSEAPLRGDFLSGLTGEALLGSLSGSVGDEGDLPSLPTTPMDESEVDFMEVFTDLSAQIAKDYGAEQQELETIETEIIESIIPQDTSSVIVQPCIPDIESSSAAPSPQCRATLKRSAQAMETRDEISTREHVLASVSSDHDYSLKRPRYSVSSEVSETEEEPLSVSSTSVVSSSISTPSTSARACVTSGGHAGATSGRKQNGGAEQISKSEKYVERRTKNNIASKRSRQTRKQKFVSMEETAVSLEKENLELEKKIEMMEELAKAMKEDLIKRMAKK